MGLQGQIYCLFLFLTSCAFMSCKKISYNNPPQKICGLNTISFKNTTVEKKTGCCYGH